MKRLRNALLALVSSMLGGFFPATGGPIGTFIFEVAGKYEFRDAGLFAAYIVPGLSIGSLAYRVWYQPLDVRLERAVPLMISGLAGVLLAEQFAERTSSMALRRAFSCLLLPIAGLMIWRACDIASYGYAQHWPTYVDWALSDAIALFAGISTRFFAIGGGVWFLTLFIAWNGWDTEAAIGTSFCLSIVTLVLSVWRLPRKPEMRWVISSISVLGGVVGAYGWKQVPQVFPDSPAQQVLSILMAMGFLLLATYNLCWRLRPCDRTNGRIRCSPGGVILAMLGSHSRDVVERNTDGERGGNRAL